MNKINWNTSYETGISSIDKQHKQIVKIINNLFSNSQVNTRSEIISETLTDLTQYAIQHFKYEEELLETNKYPKVLEQKESHKRYRLKIVKFCNETTNHEQTVPSELLQYLKEWWKLHILKEDMKYSSFLKELNIN